MKFCEPFARTDVLIDLRYAVAGMGRGWAVRVGIGLESGVDSLTFNRIRVRLTRRVVDCPSLERPTWRTQIRSGCIDPLGELGFFGERCRRLTDWLVGLYKGLSVALQRPK